MNSPIDLKDARDIANGYSGLSQRLLLLKAIDEIESLRSLLKEQQPENAQAAKLRMVILLASSAADEGRFEDCRAILDAGCNGVEDILGRLDELKRKAKAFDEQQSQRSEHSDSLEQPHADRFVPDYASNTSAELQRSERTWEPTRTEVVKLIQLISNDWAELGDQLKVYACDYLIKQINDMKSTSSKELTERSV